MTNHFALVYRSYQSLSGQSTDLGVGQMIPGSSTKRAKFGVCSRSNGAPQLQFNALHSRIALLPGIASLIAAARFASVRRPRTASRVMFRLPRRFGYNCSSRSLKALASAHARLWPFGPLSTRFVRPRSPMGNSDRMPIPVMMLCKRRRPCNRDAS